MLLGVSRTVPPWVAVLIVLGAIAFPVGRTLRTQWIGLATDVLLPIPFAWVGLRLLRTE